MNPIRTALTFRDEVLELRYVMAVVQFPDLGKEQRIKLDQIRTLLQQKEVFSSQTKIHFEFLLFCVEYWQHIYDSGYDIGHQAGFDAAMRKAREPAKLNSLIKNKLQGKLITHAKENHLHPRKLKATCTILYKEGKWKLESQVDEL